MNLINGVQYDSPVPLTINVNSNIDLTGATLEIFTPSNANLIVSPSTTINGFIVPANLVEHGSYKFVIKIQNKSFKGHFLVVQSGEVDEGGGGNAEF